MRKTIDMINGDPLKNLLLFSVPVFLGNLFQQLYNMADTVIVGRFLGEDALAAVGATGSIVFLVIGFTFGLTEGFSVLVAQAVGARLQNDLRKLVASTMLLTLIISVIFTLPTVLFCRQILVAGGGKGAYSGGTVWSHDDLENGTKLDEIGLDTACSTAIRVAKMAKLLKAGKEALQ